MVRAPPGRGACPFVIQGKGIALSDSEVDLPMRDDALSGPRSLCGQVQYRNQFSGKDQPVQISGENITIEKSKLSGFQMLEGGCTEDFGYPPEATLARFTRGTTVNGKNISLQQAQLTGVSVQGSDLQWTGLTLASVMTDQGNIVADRLPTIVVASLNAQQTHADGSLSFDPGAQIQMNQVDIQGLNLTGISLGQSVNLSNVHVSQVKIQGQGGNAKLILKNGLTLQNIATLDFQRSDSLTFGQDGSTVSLDGHGKNYRIERSFWNGSTYSIGSQQDLDGVAAN